MQDQRNRLLVSNNTGRARSPFALLITNANLVYSTPDPGAGIVKMQGFSSFTGNLDLTGFSCTSFTSDDLTGNTGPIVFRNSQVNNVSLPNFLSTGQVLDFWGCPLSAVDFTSLQSTGAGKHLYLAGAASVGSSTLTSVSFPALTSMGGALVMSRRYNLASFSAPLLATIDHELELDYTKALTTLSLPSLTAINYNSGNGQLFMGGHMTDIGQSGNPALSTLSLPALTTITGLLRASWCSSLTTFDPSSWTTIGNGFTVDFNRCNLTQATLDAIFVKLAAIIGSVTSGTVDLRFQNGGQLPSASGQSAAATLVAAGIKNNQGGTTLYA